VHQVRRVLGVGLSYGIFPMRFYSSLAVNSWPAISSLDSPAATSCSTSISHRLVGYQDYRTQVQARLDSLSA